MNIGDKHSFDTKDGDAGDNGEKKFNVSAWGYRHQQCVVLFFALMTAYSMRACMGVALVAMVESTNELSISNDFNISHVWSSNKSENYSDEFLIMNESVNGTNKETVNLNDTTNDEEFRTSGFLNSLLLVPPYPKFTWKKKVQDTIQSSFFWGYMILQIPAGVMAHRYGSRRLLTGALLTNSILSFGTPWAAYYGGWILLSISRFVQGLSQAFVVPSLHTFFGKWAPLEERARLAGFALGGQALGTVLGLPVTGFIAASPLGWPGIFRFFSVLAGIVGLVVCVMIADTPAKHHKISMGERRYIEAGMGIKEGGDTQRLSVPWSSILRSRGVYAIVVAHIGQTWGQLTLYSEVPSFMQKIMGVNIKANGLLTALPFLVMWFTNFFFTWLTDMLIIKKYLSPTNARKFANSIASIPAAIGLVMLAFAPKNIYVVETLLVIICSFKIAAHVGFMVNHIDISPNFAGTLMSISNFVSNLSGSQAPLVAGFILTDVTSQYQWRQVFFVAAGLYFFTNLFYVIFGTAEKAEWNDPPVQKKDLDGYEAVPMFDENIDTKNDPGPILRKTVET